MRVYAECEKCGLKGEAHRITTSWRVVIEHTCDTPANAPVHPPYAKGDFHFTDLDRRGGRMRPGFF